MTAPNADYVLYISIGNSDDKLTQREWSEFQGLIGVALATYNQIHGEWVSMSRSRFQNACWCVEVNESDWPALRSRLANLARQYRQDSIAVAFCDRTEFVATQIDSSGAKS